MQVGNCFVKRKWGCRMKSSIEMRGKEQNYPKSKVIVLRHRFAILLILLVLLIISIIVGAAVGPIAIPFSETINIIFNKLNLLSRPLQSSQNDSVVGDIRLPRVIVSGIVGAALAVSGTAMQGLFRNPLVEPGYIGVSSGAALGAVCAIYFSWTEISVWLLPGSAFLGAIFATGVILLVWRTSRLKSIVMLLLLGIGINSFFSAVMNVMVATSRDEQELRSIIYWLQGSLEARTWDHVMLVLIPIIVGSILLSLFGRELNMMLLGEEQAKSTGIPTRLIRNLILIITALITGAAVSVSGIIGFVGLIVPHMLRLIIGADHRILIPASAFGGAVFLIFADLISRVLFQPITLQVGVVSAFIGAPLFIILILRTNKGAGI